MIVALLSWYDENPAWLGGLIASLTRGDQVGHVVAVDGAYALYPGKQPRSPDGQADAIREVCRAAGLGLTLHEPASPWVGNEVEKRNTMFRLAEQVSSPSDWYLVIDGDEIVTKWGHGVPETNMDVVEVTLWKHRPHVEPHERPFVTKQVEEIHTRRIFRALRGLRVEGKHYIYRTDDQILWGDHDPSEPLDQAKGAYHIRLQHRNECRDLWRAKSARDYYELRDRLKIEERTSHGVHG